MRLLAKQMEQIKRTKNTALNMMQEHMMLHVLLAQHNQQANLNFKGDSQLSNLAMLKSKKPRRD
jgi:hypothetical protein